jgi:hypothetical protein
LPVWDCAEWFKPQVYGESNFKTIGLSARIPAASEFVLVRLMSDQIDKKSSDLGG